MPSAFEASTDRSRRAFWENLFIVAALIVIAVAAIYFRFVGQNWDDFTHLHPDERHLTQVAERVGTGGLQPTGPDADAQMQRCLERYPASGGVGPFFDAQCSNWYPRNVGFGIHVYGELPLFVVHIAADVTREVHVFQIRLNTCTALPDSPGFGECFSAAQSSDLSDPLVQQITANLGPEDYTVAINWTSYNGIHLIGRSVSAIAELLSLIFVFLTGRALYNKWVGLVAVAFGAAAVFPIQLSHFWTMDAFTNLPLMMGFYFAVRAMKRGRLLDFALFGVGFGGALASRINTLPLLGVIVLAAMIYAAPALDRRISRPERARLIQRGLTGIVVAMFVTLAVFRVTNPHAFVGGSGVLGFFNLIPHRPFLDDMAQAQYLTSGKADFPPNNQWASRTSYLFPARNIVLWGLGLPLGLAALIGVVWATVQMLRNRPGWTRHALIIAWVLVYFGYMGRQWVMTMRYYMPLYPFLAIMAAWALVELVARSRWAAQPAANAAIAPSHAEPDGEAEASWREVFPDAPPRTRPASRWRRGASTVAVGLLVFTLAFTYVWAAAFTSIYRKQLTRVSASHWVLENVPSALSVHITPDDGGAARLVSMPFWSSGQSANATAYRVGERVIVPFVAPSARIDRVIVHQLLDTARDGETKTFHAAIAADQGGTSIMTTGQITGDFGGSDAVYGGAYTVAFDNPAPLIPGGAYYLVTWTDEPLTVLRLPAQAADFTLADGVNGPTADAVLPDNPNLALGQTSAALGAIPTPVQFTAPFAGTFDRIEIAHLRNPLGDERDTVINVMLSDGASGDTLARGTLSLSAEAANDTTRSPYGDPATIVLDGPVRLAAQQALTVTLSTEDGGPAVITGSVVATEGPWDDAVPAKVCALPGDVAWSEDLPPGMADLATCNGVDPWGLYYRGEELYLSAEDDYQKQQIMQTVLDGSDYLTISSNRFYDTVTRMPTRYPMSVNYYKALFSGQLGYDLVHESVSTFEIGGIRIDDQTLPTFDVPDWVNEWESEEAFSVYDHPAVFVFKKDPARYDSAVVAEVLGAQPLNDSSMVSLKTEDPTLIGVIRWGALETTAAPTGLMMDDDLRDIQTQGGTYSSLFNRDWLVNAQPALSVVAWWLAMLAFGWIVWPILYFVLPALPDRAYPFAKIAGLLLVSWIAWVGGSLKFLTWSQGGLLLIMLAVAALSAVLVWRRRTEFFAYVRRNIRHLLVIEGITLALFAAFLLVRLGNPDLWAQTLGGEKPMNFAYFNAVLRSTVFPPYDPWYAGGFMNYYYYGYVLVGAPVKLLGIMPSVAYNLIVPTLFALTGIGAFSLAFNLAAARWFHRDEPGSEAPDAAPAARRRFALRVPAANPYLAGTLALLVCVVLGNLGTPAVFLTGVVRAGGCSETQDMLTWQTQRFIEREGRQPTPPENMDLYDTAASPSIADQLAFSLDTARQSLECLGRGIGQAFGGGWLPVGPERWYWGPRSIITELPNANNEINEFPIFTFIFGDLHAHMIALPLTMLALSWLVAEILGAGVVRRPAWVIIGATLLGALVVGILRPTNSWDWITYLLLGLGGLVFAFFRSGARLNRKNLIGWGSVILLFLVTHVVVVMPFTAHFSTAYTSVIAFEGQKTPLWAYMTMHGVFLFVILSLLIWQTARLVRLGYVRDFVGQSALVRAFVVVVVLTAAVTAFLALAPIRIFILDLPVPLALITVPLIVWCAVLIVIPEQPREWQIVYAMIAAGLAISLGVEFVVLGGDIGRQNTFFKFYMQIWVLFSVASGVGLAWLLHAARAWQPATRSSWQVCIAVLLALAGLFPITATQGRNQMRMAPAAPNTLDGDEYMAQAVYYSGSTPVPLGTDLKLIHWLQDNVQGTPVVLEGREPGSEYKYNGRIAINTGLPTILGWRFHQVQQRTLDPLPNLVNQRESNTNSMYDSPDVAITWRLLQFYHVEYIVVSDLERLNYTADGLAKFDTMVNLDLLEVAFETDGAKIYHVVPGAGLHDVLVGMGETP